MTYYELISKLLVKLNDEIGSERNVDKLKRLFDIERIIFQSGECKICLMLNLKSYGLEEYRDLINSIDYLTGCCGECFESAEYNLDTLYKKLIK